MHTFAEQSKCYVDEELVAQQIKIARDNVKECGKISDPFYSNSGGEGEVVRDALTEYVKLNLPDHLVH